MNKLIICVSFFLLSISITGQDISIGKRNSLQSVILNESRPFSVYLPPSYFKNDIQKFPVLYILDGDYNFRYVTGLIELQSSIAQNIPEMIVIGISGKGSKEYRKNCKPNIKVKDKGNADKLLLFMEKELIPYINNNYKTTDYKILSGHSVGGLFVVNAALTKPNLFNNYIAISPALWWENNAINSIANTFTKNSQAKPQLYLSLANEKGMGVSSFLKTVTQSIFSYNWSLYFLALLFLLLAIYLFLKIKQKAKKLFLSISVLLIGLWFSFANFLNWKLLFVG